ncbi:MAG TPA: ParB N-terminal domain-containing protein [Thermoplasmata archaeon]|jgi:L-serine kinase (ADP)|nr:ParB N-terminal domain-containing protein [Thermoplasmata archaeon]
MKRRYRFALVPLARLKGHEQIEPAVVEALVAELTETGVLKDPIWVARGSGVILNGHHRVAALRRLKAARVPAWVIEYEAPDVRLDRWTPGPELDKAEVVRRARTGELFPPKTTRHRLDEPPPSRAVPLDRLLRPGRPRRQRRPSRPSRSGVAGASGAR